MSKITTELVDKSIELAEMIFQFARVERTTLHEDNQTPESDTDHTVMLGVFACALAEKLCPKLNRGLIAQYVFVHDLVEVYAGDVDTFGNEVDHAAKNKNEAMALAKIKAKFSATFPWITDTIEQYETLSTPEARFVKVTDKIMPKLTRILNGYQETDMSKEEVMQFLYEQRDAISVSYGSDQELLVEFLDHVITKFEKINFISQISKST